MKNKFLLCCILGTVLNLNATWTITSSNDKMTDEKSVSATTDLISPTEKMRPPYNNIKSYITVGCNKKTNWIYVGFTELPNLSNKGIKNGYNSTVARIKIDNNLSEERLDQLWGAKFLNFSKKDEIIEKIKNSQSLLLELTWYENGLTYFKYDTRGAAKAIDSIFSACENEVNKDFIPLTTLTLPEQKNECAEKGGSNSWDFKKDIYKCLKK